MGVLYGLVRDGMKEKFHLGKGDWPTIFSWEFARIELSGAKLAEKIDGIRAEAPASFAAARIKSWAGDRPVRLIHDDQEVEEWEWLETGSIQGDRK